MEALGKMGLQSFAALGATTCAAPENMVVHTVEKGFFFTLGHFDFFFSMAYEK